MAHNKNTEKRDKLRYIKSNEQLLHVSNSSEYMYNLKNKKNICVKKSFYNCIFVNIGKFRRKNTTQIISFNT